MGKLQRYFWPKTALLFHLHGETIEAAFGYFEKGGLEIAERRTVPTGRKSDLEVWYGEIRRTYPRTYAAATLDTFNQGALPGCGKGVLRDFGVDGSLVHTLCVDGRWTAYASLVEMKWFEQKFREIEFDYLFSPFVLLYEKSRPMLDESPGLYVLHQKGVAFLMVLSRDRMWYAHVVSVTQEREAPLEESGAAEELAFDLEMLDDEEEIAPIENVDLLDDFRESEGAVGGDEADEEALEALEYNLNLFEEIKEAIGRYYRDERYPQAFVEKVVLFDMEEIGSDFVRYVEDELFMEASVHPFDPIETMADLMAREEAG
ncbi:hypothetical protein [Hydrogenimonas sp.]